MDASERIQKSEISGWLYKKQKLLPRNAKRFFTLSAQILSSHKNKRSVPSWGVKVLGAEIIGKENTLCIVVKCPERTVKLFMRSPDEYYHWLESLIYNSSRGIEDYYQLGDCIGAGAFGRVVMASVKRSNDIVAIKMIDKTEENTDERDLIWREINVLRSVSHPNVIQTYDIFETETCLHIVMEYMAGGSLGDVIQEKGKLTEKEARVVLRDILNGVAYLQENSIVHRDLKLANILCKNKEFPFTCKVADFGLSNFVGMRSVSKDILRSQVGSPHYVAPEVLRGDPYGPLVDSWAVGIILHVLLTKRFPFSAETVHETLEQIITGRFSVQGPEWRRISTEAKSLVHGLLEDDTQIRLSAREALAHPWFAIPREHHRRN